MSEFIYSIFYKISDVIVTVLLLILAFFVAWLVKRLLIKLLKAVKAETLLSKLGIKESVIKTSVQFAGEYLYRTDSEVGRIWYYYCDRLLYRKHH